MKREQPHPGLFVGIGGAAVVLAVLMRIHAALPFDAMAEGLAFTGAGIAAWARRPDNRIGKLMVAYGFLVWSVHLGNTGNAVLATAAPPLFLITIFGILPYTILAFPEGRLTSLIERVLFGIAAGNCIWQIASLTIFDPQAFGCVDCQNLLLIESLPDVAIFMGSFNPWWLTLAFVPMIFVLARKWVKASPPLRRVLTPMLIPAVVFLLANRVYGLAQAFFPFRDFFAPRPSLLEVLSRVEQVAIIVLPLTFLIGLARGRLRHARVGKLVIELGNLPHPERLENALSRALGDPALKIGRWDPDTDRYVGTDGRELVAPESDSNLVATRLERAGEPLALMVHDRALLDDPGLVEATAAAARLTVENERLQEEVEAQLEEVRASRQRIVSAQDEERRKIERDLHDGAQQRLLRLSMALQVAESSLPETPDPALRASLEVAADELRSALQELRELARGIHPAVLTQRGLGAAFRSLAETAALPVNIEEVPEERLPSEVEAAAYFVASEALANVAKHASATHAILRGRILDESLQIEVGDDGVGGASSSRGSGLRGLTDRVEALGGTLTVQSLQGRGTSVVALIPIDRVEPEVPSVEPTVSRRTDP